MNISSYIARQFSKPTGFGGKIVTAIMNKQNHPLYESTERLLSPRDAERILDIGCGNGYVLEMLAEQYDCDYTGIDISESILKTASNRNCRFIKNGKMIFKHGEASKIPFGDATFDKAYTINTVYFWKDLNDTILEIKRILKPHGIFINTLYTNETLARLSHTQFGYKRFTPEQLTTAAGRAGFETEIMPIMNGTAYCIVCRL